MLTIETILRYIYILTAKDGVALSSEVAPGRLPGVSPGRPPCDLALPHGSGVRGCEGSGLGFNGFLEMVISRLFCVFELLVTYSRIPEHHTALCFHFYLMFVFT